MTDSGGYLPYGIFREALKHKKIEPSCWKWNALLDRIRASFDAELPGFSLLALSRTDALTECEIVPGISLSVQALAPDMATPRHAHAWWHIYVVQAGSGVVSFDDESEPQRIVPNDIVFIPAWCTHELKNDGPEQLVTLNCSNMVQQSDLANFRPG